MQVRTHPVTLIRPSPANFRYRARSAIVADNFGERDPDVKEIIRRAVARSKRNGKHCGLCDQVPSDYPEMADFQVKTGIASMRFDPDTLLQTTQLVLEPERRLGGSPVGRTPLFVPDITAC